MIDEREDALKAFLRAYDERLAAAPLLDRRTSDRRGARPHLVEASRVPAPVDRAFAYWVSPRGNTEAAR